jgi:hypothetical protein
VGLSGSLLDIRGAATSLIASTARLTIPLLGSLGGAFGFERFTDGRDVFFAADLELFFAAFFVVLMFFLATFFGGFFAPDFLAAFFTFLAIVIPLIAMFK